MFEVLWLYFQLLRYLQANASTAVFATIFMIITIRVILISSIIMVIVRSPYQHGYFSPFSCRSEKSSYANRSKAFIAFFSASIVYKTTPLSMIQKHQDHLNCHFIYLLLNSFYLEYFLGNFQ